MSKFTSKDEFIADIDKERSKLDELLTSIPDEEKTVEVVDGMSVKDFLAHRAEWGRMMIGWYEEARSGGQPAVPSEKYKWNQLRELNAEIHQRFADTPLGMVESEFNRVHDHLYQMIEDMDEAELFEKKRYTFTGSSDLITYLNSATAAHYRSARRHIAKWWKARTEAA